MFAPVLPLGKTGANSITGFHIKWIYNLMPFLFTNIIIASAANSDLSTFWPLKNDLYMVSLQICNSLETNLGYIFAHQGGGGKV